MATLVLWDIDGTLVDSARTGLDAFIDAFAEIHGEWPRDFPSFAGRTDLEIAHMLFELHGIDPGDGLLARFEEVLERLLASHSGVILRVAG